MAEGQGDIVKTDQGAINARILAKEVKTDFRRVESASLKMTCRFQSAEGKRLFVRYFHSLQLLVHFVSVIARTKLEAEDIEKVEASIRQKLEAVNKEMNTAIDGAELLFRNHAITTFATYDTQPLELKVGIISSSGRRFYEILEKFDQLMPLLQTLEIHEVITVKDADIQRHGMKRSLRTMMRSIRSLASGIRRRMNEHTGKDGGVAAGDQVANADEAASADETMEEVTQIASSASDIGNLAKSADADMNFAGGHNEPL